MKLKPDEVLFIRPPMTGRLVRVTAIFDDIDQANAFMALNHDQGVIAEFGPLILVASMHDLGEPALTAGVSNC